MTYDPRGRSRVITDGLTRAGARAMLKAVGYTDEDLSRPIIGIANTWIETMPCNLNLRRLAARVKEGVRAAGGTPMEFNTIAISDGVTMGTEGMKASLVSREVIADSVELVARGHLFDAVVALGACDKTIPGLAMALIRLDVPSLFLYGGTILPGRYRGRDVDILSVYEAVGATIAGSMTPAELKELEDVACPGAGACGGQYTANTMATVMEAIGLSPLGTASVPAVDPRKDEIGRRAGELVMDVLRQGLRPSQILTRRAFENAVAAVAATGGAPPPGPAPPAPAPRRRPPPAAPRLAARPRRRRQGHDPHPTPPGRCAEGGGGAGRRGGGRGGAGGGGAGRRPPPRAGGGWGPAAPPAPPGGGGPGGVRPRGAGAGGAARGWPPRRWRRRRR